MTELEKAIRYFKAMRDDAKAILDSGFGKKDGESNTTHKNHKMYAQLAIDALEKQIPKKPVVSSNDKEVPKTHRLGRLLQYRCPNCNNHVLVRYETDTPENGYTLSIHFKNCSRCGQRIDFGDLYRKTAGNEKLELED